MPPPIIDLISDDDDDFEPPPQSTRKGKTANPTPAHRKKVDISNKRNAAGTGQGNLNETIDPSALIWEADKDERMLHIAKSRSSTISSHTERGSPSEEQVDRTARRDKGKGKQRETEIPEIDLSQLDSDGDGDDGDQDVSGPSDVEVILDHGNGELSEDEALRRAIALSLQDQTPRHDSSEGAGASTSSTSRDKAKAKLKEPAGQLMEAGSARHAEKTMTDLPDDRTISLSPTPSPDVLPITHRTARGLLTPPSPGSTSTASAPVVLEHPTTQNGPENPAPTSTPNCPLPSTVPGRTTSVFSLANLDRRQMEAERLARQKRKLEEELNDGHHGEGHIPKVVKLSQSATATMTRKEDSTGTALTLSNRQHRADDGHKDSGGSRHQSHLPARSNRAAATAAAPEGFKANQCVGAAEPASSSGKTGITGNDNGNGSDIPTCLPPVIHIDDTNSSSSSTLNLYPDGVALKTYIAGHGSAGTINFEKLVSPSSRLESCLLSSFIWDFDWLLPHFATRRTKFQLVMHADDAGQRESLERDFQGVPNVRLTFPPLGGNVNCMHSKLMLLFYKDEEGRRDDGPPAVGRSAMGWSGGQRCRIVVPTANLVDFDWGVGDFMENTVWLIDLPAKSTSAASLHGATAGSETSFEKSLKAFLRAQTVPDDVVRKLELFDFRKTERYGFVHSIGGMHGGQAWQTTGLCGLGRTITELGLASQGPIQMDYVTSSVGSLNDEFLRSMHLAASGDNGLTEYTRRVGKKGPAKHGNWKENLRFYFPSDNTVQASKGGPRNAGTICFSITWWNNPKFPRSIMYDCVSVRDGLLMHNKLLFVRYTSPIEKSQSGNTGWVYVGSANLSESAWGRLVQDKATKKPRLNCRNWECGVIIPIPAMRSGFGISTVKDRDSAGLALFNHIVPVPMRFPVESLENKKPWAFSS